MSESKVVDWMKTPKKDEKPGDRMNEWIVANLVKIGIDHFFVVTGGAIAPLIDAIGRIKGTTLVCFQHEQGAAMAAEGYFRACGKICVVLATSGPGAQNLLNGICGCFYDSIPALFVCGQVNQAETLEALPPEGRPRQLGFQETPVCSAYSAFVKYAKRLKGLEEMQTVFQAAIAAMVDGRFGPAVIDLPVNYQMAECPADIRKLSLSFPANSVVGTPAKRQKVDASAHKEQAKKIIDMIKAAKRPLLLLGNGIRLAGMTEVFRACVESGLKVPFLLSWGAKDLFPANHALNQGNHGVYGSRGSNFTAQNCDLLVVIGSRMDTRQTGGNLKGFATEAKKVMIDIDAAEIKKFNGRGITIDLSVVAALEQFLPVFADEVKAAGPITAPKEWTSKILEWKKTYTDACEFDHEDRYKDPHSVYNLLEALSRKLPSNATIIPDQGGNLCWSMQCFKLTKGQRFFTNLANSSMGYAYPAALGAAIATPDRMIVAVGGDGGIQMNIHFMKTAVDYNLPIKVFIISNGGYGIIRQFQSTYFNDRYIATVFDNTDLVAVAKGYGMEAIRLGPKDDIDKVLDYVLACKKPILCDLIVDPDQKIIPKLNYGNSLENLSPLIPVDVLEKTLLVKPPKPVGGGWVLVKDNGEKVEVKPTIKFGDKGAEN